MQILGRTPVNHRPPAQPKFSAGTDVPVWERVEAHFETRKDTLNIPTTNVRPQTIQVINKPLHHATILSDTTTKQAWLEPLERVSYFVIGDDATTGRTRPLTLLTFAKDKATQYWQFASAGVGRNLDILFKAYKTYHVRHPLAQITKLEGLPGQATGFIQAIMLNKPNVVEVLETRESAFPHNDPIEGYPLSQGDRMTAENFAERLDAVTRL